MSRLASGALALLACSLPLSAAGFDLEPVSELRVDDVRAAPEGRHEVELYLRVLADSGEPVGPLRSVDLVIHHDGRRVPAESVALSTLAEAGLGSASVVLLDGSRRMKGEPFYQARQAALRFLDRVGHRDRVAILCVSDEVEEVAGFGATRAEAKVRVGRLVADDEALEPVLLDGLHRALGLLRGDAALPRRRFVLVFSDGSDAGSRRTLEEVLERGRAEQGRPPIPIHAVAYARFGGAKLATLQTLAAGTGGSFAHLGSILRVDEAFQAAWFRMVHSFVVRYPAAMDGTRHRVEVEVEGQRAGLAFDAPRLRSAPWPWALGTAGAAAAGGALWLWWGRGRGAGRLIVSSGSQSGHRVALSGRRLRIGGLPDNDLVLQSRAVSRHHAEIRWDRRSVEIEDLGSSNGTFVNDHPVRKAPLRTGDRIRVGDVEMVYQG